MPKIKKVLSFILTFFVLLLGFFFLAKPFVQAVEPKEGVEFCDLSRCIPDEGWCEDGAVMKCIEGEEQKNVVKKCSESRWVATTETVNNKCNYDSAGVSGARNKIEEALTTTGINSAKWVIGDSGYVDEEEEIPGMIDYIVEGLNIKLMGPPTTSVKGVQTKKVGAIGVLGGFIGYMIEAPPVNTKEYLADLGSSIGFSPKPAYAQGTGWEALQPILPIWKAFRNVAYLAFVIIFVVIGFMIMFRAKINPQTVISLQSALPKVIITLILVTFSYAIAGLMIDLIYILLYFIVGILSLGGLVENIQDPIDLLLTNNPFQLIFKKGAGTSIFIQGPSEAIKDIIDGAAGEFYSDTGLGSFAGGLAKLVMGSAIFFSLFKLFFSLILSYLGIIISVIFAPFNILFNAIPGSNSFAGWIKGLFSNIIVFPVIAAMFLLTAILIGPMDVNEWKVTNEAGFFNKGEDSQVWVPPMLSLGKDGGVGDANAIKGLIAFGMIMMMPQVVTRVKKMLKVEPSGFGAAIMGGVMAGPSAITGVGQASYSAVSQISQMRYQKEMRESYKRAKQPFGGGNKET